MSGPTPGQLPGPAPALAPTPTPRPPQGTAPSPPRGTAPSPATAPRSPGRLALVGGLILALGLAGMAAAWVGGPGIGEDRIEIPIHYSSFTRDVVTVRAGRSVTFVLRNADPIDHEWLVGDAEFHERHRTGTDGHHGARATEVTIRAGATVTTTVTFRSPGEYLFICHLPGHEAYGMVGVVRVMSPPTV